MGRNQTVGKHWFVEETAGNVLKAATRGQGSSWKLLDKYDDVNFDSFLGT